MWYFGEQTISSIFSEQTISDISELNQINLNTERQPAVWLEHSVATYHLCSIYIESISAIT